MSMLNEIKIILTMFKLPVDIKSKILILFIGFVGTPSSNAIKSQIIRFNNKSLYNSSLVEKIILENDIYTLWRVKVMLNKGKCFSFAKYVNLYSLYAIYELQIAYLLGNEISKVEKQSKTNILKQAIINNKCVELFRMFYNLDKHNKYSQDCDTPNYFGTPTSNIINSAIYCGVIKQK
jgi:hypothetical protein